MTLNKAEILKLFKQETKEKNIPKLWFGFTGFTLGLIIYIALEWIWFLLKLIYKIIRSWRIILSCFVFLLSILFVLGKYLSPFIMIFGNLWIFRDTLILIGVKIAKDKKGVILRQFKIDGNIKKRELGLDITNVGLKAQEEEPEEMLILDLISLNLKKEKSKKNIDVEILLDGLTINIITYDNRFKDTNISRLLEALQSDDSQEENQEEKKEDIPSEEQNQNQNNFIKLTAKLKNVKIVAKSSGKMFGTRQLGAPITIDEEVIDTDTLKSKTKLIAWINAFILRQITSGAFNIGTSVVDGAGGLVTGVTNGILGGVDTVADKVPGGSLIKGATGGVRSVVGGTFGGVSKVTHGVAGGGKAIVGGITSGSVSGMKEGFQKAGTEIGGGVVGGIQSIGGGVVGAGSSVVEGVTNTSTSKPPDKTTKKKSWFTFKSKKH